jgi:osmotically-inducible protein OsmY
MNLKHTTILLAAVTAMALAMPAQTAQCKPDNSKQNAAQGQTADNQPNAVADRKTTQQIRKAVIAEKDLSVYAHNCKIITRAGSVTLKGPVQSDDEKQKIGSIAESVVGAGRVTNDLTVKSN